MAAEAFVKAIEGELGCEFEALRSDAWSVRLDGSRTLIAVDAKAATMRVATPLDAANDGLPADDLLELLCFSFPNDTARGSYLAPGAAAGTIELLDVVPLPSIAPADAPRIVLDQIAATLVIAEHLAEHRARRRAPTGG